MQAIDDDWNLHILPIAFKQSFGSHNFKSIKDQFDTITKEFNIDNKILKILADQAAANKKAFKNVVECEDVVDSTVRLILKKEQNKKNL